jgi:hypothetical protein
MFGDSRVKWVSGKYVNLGNLETTGIALSDADANAGTVKRGKMMRISTTNADRMAYGSGYAEGFLTRKVDADGTTSLQAKWDMAIGNNSDLPVKRGAVVTLRCPLPGAIMEFEGVGTAIVDNLVCTSGTGALSAATAVLTELSVQNGCWRVAQAGEKVLALMLDPTLTPENTGELRIKIRFVSPYPKA